MLLDSLYGYDTGYLDIQIMIEIAIVIVMTVVIVIGIARVTVYDCEKQQVILQTLPCTYKEVHRNIL